VTAEPLRVSFAVRCGPEHAWATWTRRTALWWPRSHTVSGERDLDIVFEPRPGGRIFERTPAGDEADWGEIVAWEPPWRLVYRWHLRQDVADATEVEIAFSPVAGGSTHVDIQHRGWERLGEHGPARRDANRRGWAGVLEPFAAACAAYS
jgi:uncharacterized protein YndB with AHSA1/START domain